MSAETTPFADMTFEQLRDVKVGTVLHDVMDRGVRFIVARGPGALCAYVGVPSDHPLAGHDYDSLPIDCHGGLTYAEDGGGFLPKGRYWYGWDYAHLEDVCFHDFNLKGSKAWLVNDVVGDAWTALYEFEKLVGLAERIARRGWAKTGGAE